MIDKVDVGSVVSWETFGGNKHEGQIIEDDGDCWLIRLADGTVKAVNK